MVAMLHSFQGERLHRFILVWIIVLLQSSRISQSDPELVGGAAAGCNEDYVDDTLSDPGIEDQQFCSVVEQSVGGEVNSGRTGVVQAGGEQQLAPGGDTNSLVTLENAKLADRKSEGEQSGGVNQVQSSGTGEQSGDVRRVQSPGARIAPVGLNEYRKRIVTDMQRTLQCNADGDQIRHRLETGGEEYNFAAAVHGAKIVAANKEAKGASSILHNDKEKYYRSPCSAEEKFVIVELSEEALVDIFGIANFELYSANLKDFELFGSLTYPTDDWRLLGKFEAENARHAQKFRLSKPEWVRYLKLRMETHHGTEFYCTLSMIEVYGIDAIECLLEEWLGTSGAPRQRNNQAGLQVPASYVGRELKNLRPGSEEESSENVDVKTESIQTIIDSYVQPSRLGDSVLKLIMQKVKALEMNQTLLDRYVEHLNSNYKEHFGDFERELSLTNKAVHNLTTWLSNVVTLVEKMEETWEEDWIRLRSKLSEHVKSEALHLKTLKDQLQHMENRETLAVTMALFLLLVSVLARLLSRCVLSFQKLESLELILFLCLFVMILSV